ncbi:MAG: hypothetical protein GXP25_06500 [Planctomycetes bacterium]|nr:hypothetical protein [Planctomycetota bacterium]
MTPLIQRRLSILFAVTLLACAAGCAHLAHVREINQDLAVDRRGRVVVMPLAATASLCDPNFAEGELEGAKDHFRRLVRENLSYSLSKHITVIHPKAVDKFLARQGFGEDQHYDKRLSMQMARKMDAQIVCFGYVKIDPVLKESLIEKSKRYDLDFEVYLFDVTNDERLATLRCAGKRKDVIRTIPWMIKKLTFHPPLWPAPGPIPLPPKEEKKPKKEGKEKGKQRK